MVNYKFCEMQYFMTYVLGYRTDSGKKAELGTIVHKVMEVISFLKKFEQDNPKRKTLECTDEVTGKIRIKAEELYTDDFLRTLEDLCFESYTKDSKHKWTKGDRKEVTKLVNVVMEHGVFDPRKRDILYPEPHFDMAIEEPWAKYDFVDAQGNHLEGQLAIKGTIDLVTKVDDDTIEVVDWKTGQRKDWVTGEVKDYDKLQNDPQLLLYHYAISKMFPDYKNVIMTIYFIRPDQGGPFTLFFEDEDRDRFLGILKDRYKDIVKNDNPKPLSRDRSHWKCTRICHYCKNDWEGTNTNMCQYVGDYLDEHGMDKTVVDLTAPGHSIGYYEAPG